MSGISNTTLFRWAQCYLVPGLIFQSVIVGGGYGTGREIAEFFLVHGSLGGLLGMVVSCLVWGVVMAIAFEFARVTRSYNYQTFFQALLGRFWWLFEVIYLLIVLLVLAVLGSAAGEIAASLLGFSPLSGTIVLMIMVGLLTFFGSKIIEKVFVGWSLLLYLTYVVVLLYSFDAFGEQITDVLEQGEATGNWGLDGMRYAAYNLNALAAVLFVVPRFQQTREAVGAGLLAGVVAIIPAVLVFLVLLSAYPAIIHSPVPIIEVLSTLQIVWLLVMLQTMLFGTFIETGTGIIHAFNERLANTFHHNNKPFPDWLRAAVALGSLIVAIFLAQGFGIVALIARGYGMLSYGYIAVVIIPLLTVGLARVVRARSRPRPPA